MRKLFILSIRNGYLIHIRGARGLISEEKSFIKGVGTKFEEELKIGDYIYPINKQHFINSFSQSKNIRYNIDVNQLCRVSSIHDNTLLSTNIKCLLPIDYVGPYLIITLMENEEMKESSNSIKHKKIFPRDPFLFSELSFDDNIRTYSIHSNLVNGNLLQYNEFAMNKFAMIHNLKSNFNSNNFMLMHNNTDINIDDNYKFLTSPILESETKFLEHDSLKFPNDIRYNFVLEMRLANNIFNPIVGVKPTILSLILTFHDSRFYQLIIDSFSGILLKELNLNNINDSKIVKIYTTSNNQSHLFYSSTKIRMLFANKSIYLVFIDNMGKSEIKFVYDFSAKIKSIKFDLNNSSNLSIKDLNKRNYILKNDVLLIYEHMLRLNMPNKSKFIEHYAKGDICDTTGNPRISIVEYSCNPKINDFNVEEVNEDNTCEYHYKVSTRHICSLDELTNNTFQDSVINTKCKLYK